MTTPSAPADNPDAPPADPAATETPTAPPPNEPESTNSEAAKYRIERNEARTERDTLTGRLATLQRRECEAAIADLLEVPGDLWDLGQANPTDFYGDTDELNPEELRAAAEALVKTRPGLAKQRKFEGTPNWGQTSATPPTATSSWDQVVKGR